ncbi:uncharacterized protein LOC120355496 [Nilaparvata lugens]|uniref:uncharacterized protein LOC120355496 n=1 Tax=Nilaparvata lugens TaxID=108931 RepID=UPI00193DF257|nr:uncharacterized protein LOC120355496 [Nilaparvata lugens]
MITTIEVLEADNTLMRAENKSLKLETVELKNFYSPGDINASVDYDDLRLENSFNALVQTAKSSLSEVSKYKDTESRTKNTSSSVDKTEKKDKRVGHDNESIYEVNDPHTIKRQSSSQTKENNEINSHKKSINKNRILVLADSHGRKIWKFIGNKLPNYDVQVFFKPNATMERVIEGVEKQIENFGSSDFLIVMGGTNDIGAQTSRSVNKFKKVLDILVPMSLKTNLIMTTIPHRFDRPQLNQTIDEINDAIHKHINSSTRKNSKRIRMCFINERLRRANFTRHGLHLNGSGYNILCTRLAELVENKSPCRSVDKKESFLMRWLKRNVRD